MPYSVLCLTRRRPDLTFAEYKNHYETVHAPMVTRLLSPHAPDTYVRHYIDHSDETAFYVGKPEEVEYDCCAVFTYKDKAAWQLGLTRFYSPDLQGPVTADEEKFLDRSCTKLVVVGESPCTFKPT
jgi:hypothetical protein